MQLKIGAPKELVFTLERVKGDSVKEFFSMVFGSEDVV